MIYTLFVQTSPFQSSSSAYLFAKELLQKKHQINCVFFYNEGVFTANKNIDFPVDEKPIGLFWQDLAQKHDLQLSVCLNTALRRGVAEKDLLSKFNFASIGIFLEFCEKADRVITFKN